MSEIRRKIPKHKQGSSEYLHYVDWILKLKHMKEFKTKQQQQQNSE